MRAFGPALGIVALMGAAVFVGVLVAITGRPVVDALIGVAVLVVWTACAFGVAVGVGRWLRLRGLDYPEEG